MRVLLGWLLLFGLAALAGLGTAYWRAHARERGDSATRVQGEEAFGVPARILIGKHSGADQVRTEGTSAPDATLFVGEESEPLVNEVPAPPPLPTPFKMTVRPGSTLSKICQDFYVEAGRPPLTAVVEAVALWNGLSSPDDLRAGQSLELPPLASLFP